MSYVTTQAGSTAVHRLIVQLPVEGGTSEFQIRFRAKDAITEDRQGD